jgi:glycine hydroxymethyltransferase
LTGGTDNHTVIVNLKTMGLTGSKFEGLAELCNVSVNKNTVVTDKSALSPSGIRLGSAAMTSRGFEQDDMEFVANILDKIAMLAKEINSLTIIKRNSSKLKEFLEQAMCFKDDIQKIAEEVREYCKKFPLPSCN